MKEVLVIRHGEKQDDNLTEQGVAECIALSNRIGSFNVAISSQRNRAIQTAELISKLTVRPDVRANVPAFPDSKLAGLLQAQSTNPLGIIGAIWEDESLINDSRVAGSILLELVKETLSGMKADERALIVSHDGTMIGLEKLLKNESFDYVDHSFEPLEGFSIDESLIVHQFKPNNLL